MQDDLSVTLDDEDLVSGDEEDILRRESDIQRNRLHQIGFKSGLFAGRQMTLQAGFDLGYRCGLVSSFSQALSGQLRTNMCPINESLHHIHDGASGEDPILAINLSGETREKYLCDYEEFGPPYEALKSRLVDLVDEKLSELGS